MKKVNIEKIALLARIKLTDGEGERLKKEFEDILGYMSVLRKADVSGVGDEGVSKTTNLINVMRKDEDFNEPGVYTEKLLNEVPLIEKGHVKVKHVFDR